MNNNVVIAGAGKIGRGYLAEIFQNVGFHITFLVHSPEQTEKLRNNGQYIIFRGNKEETAVEEVVIKNYDAVCSVTEKEKCIDALVAADTVMLPIYPAACKDFGELIGKAINIKAEKEEKLFNIIMCVNFLEATQQIVSAILPHLTEKGKDYFDRLCGVSESLVNRLVAAASEEMLKVDELAVSAGYGDSLKVDSDTFKDKFPEGINIELQKQLPARFTYKIWITNMKHFSASIYGSYLKYQYVREAAGDPYVKKCIKDMAQAEAEFAVSSKFNIPMEIIEKDFRSRYEPWLTWANPNSNDPFARVVFDMRRKLAKSDRVIGPALACLKGGRKPFFLASVAAMAMIYKNENDPTSVELHDILDKEGVYGVLREFSKLDENDPDEAELMELISNQYILLNR